ncbi:BBA14 family lipoprotein [Borrelia sp. P9F1]|uniref:BBA14 family lipoprotein n=1 Tax=Borrelia sp. P9F1 TaxID=3058374 RepID=UPI00264A32EA|nr:BBA14 family lipoprotein [Borrelia sp. P9F1]WKC58521.1 hypothetical protein QYZ68_04700 [Borrelia sp. P9F1]
MFVRKKILPLLSLLLLLLLASCSSLASLPVEPDMLDGDNIESLVVNEAELYKYCLTLNAWLVTARDYVGKYYPADKFPYFQRFDSQYEGGAGLTGVRSRILYYKKYAEEMRPIAQSIYAAYKARKE